MITPIMPHIISVPFNIHYFDEREMRSGGNEVIVIYAFSEEEATKVMRERATVVLEFGSDIQYKLKNKLYTKGWVR